MKENDVELIHRILDGDDTALSDLIEKYQKQVHALAWRKIGDFHIAEEITQDTFLKAYQKLSTLRNPQRLAGWLYVIATRCCQAWLRKKQIQTEPLEEIDSEEIQPEAYSRYVVEEEAKDTVVSQRQVVKKLLATLPESERTVITLHYFGEMTCEKMSEFLGVSANTIKSRLRRARNRLKQEEPMIREAISNFQISPHLTDDIMREVARLKPAAPNVSKPLMPWVIGGASTVLIVLMLGLGSQHLMRFQQPYSLDTQAERTVDIVDAPIVQNVVSNPDVRNQPGLRSITGSKGTGNGKESHQVLGNEGESTQWNLPIGAKTRLGKGSINGISFSPDGTQIAVGSATGVWIYDANTGAELSVLTDHTTHTGQVAFSPDGNTLASGMYDNISLWNTDTGKHLKTFKISHASMDTLKIIDDGKTLLCKSDQGWVRLWDITTGKKSEIHPKSSGGFSRFLSLVFGRTVSAADLYDNNVDGDSIFAVGYEDGKIRLEDAITGRHLKTLQGHKDSVSQLAFSPDGKLLASVAFGNDRPLRLWDVTTGNLLKTLTHNANYWGILTFSNDGKTLACETWDGDIELWDVATKTLRTTLGENLEFNIPVLAFSQDSKRVAGVTRDSKIRIWDVNTGNELFSFKTGHTYKLKELAFSPDNSLLAAGQDRTIQLWDVETFTQLSHRIDTDGYSAFVFSPDGNTLTSATEFTFRKRTRDELAKESVTGTLNVWDTQTGNILSSFPVESHKGEVPKLPGQTRSSMSSSAMGSYIVEFSKNGHLLATVLNSDRATKDNRFTVLLWEVWEDPRRQKHLTLKGHTDEIHALAFTYNGKMLASGGDDGKIRLWDTSTGNQMSSLRSSKVRGLEFSLDGKILASSSANKVQLWDISTGKLLTSLIGLNRPVTDLEFSPDNKILASGNRYGLIQLWDISTGRRLASLKGHTYWVEELVFSSDGKTLASGGSEGDIFIWNVPN